MDYLTNALEEAESHLNLAALPDHEPARQAAIYQEAVARLLKTRSSIGDAVVRALWHVYREGLVMFLGKDGAEYNPDEFTAWVHDTFSDCASPDYLTQLAYVVERVLQKVYERQMAGDPFVLPTTTETITVDSILNQPGVLGKVRRISSVFMTADEDQQATLLDAAVNGTRRQVEQVRDDIQGKRIQLKLPYREIPKLNGKYDLILSDLDHDQVRLFESLLQGVAEPIFA
jgi:hypothetical protein